MTQSPVPFLLLILAVIFIFGCETTNNNLKLQDRPPTMERDRGSNR